LVGQNRTLNFQSIRYYHFKWIAFDGAGDRIETGQIAAFNLSAAGTIEGWVKFITLSTARRLFGTADTGGKFLGIITGGSDSSKLEWNHFGTGTLMSTATGVVATNTWYFIQLINDGTNVKIYVDGVEKASAANAYRNLNALMWFGGAPAPFAGSELNGSLDDIRVCNIARTPGVPTAQFPDA